MYYINFAMILIVKFYQNVSFFFRSKVLLSNLIISLMVCVGGDIYATTVLNKRLVYRVECI